MIEQYLIGAAAGGMLCAMTVWRWQRRIRGRETEEVREELAESRAALRDVELHYGEQLGMCQSVCEELETEKRRLEETVEEQSRAMDAMRAAMEQAGGKRMQWVVETKKIAEEAARLKGLAATFERWHEQMNVLMARNEDMHEKNQELADIVKHVVIVSMNASIEAAKAAAAGRGFAVVANEVRSLALRTEDLSKVYSDSLHKNDLTTTAAFQDIQAGGKMIMASLSRVEAFSSQLQDQLQEAAI